MCWQVAKRFVESALEYSREIVVGDGPQGPFDHLLRMKREMQGSRKHWTFEPKRLFLYAVTDPEMNRRWGRSVTDAVKAAIEGGATIVQLR